MLIPTPLSKSATHLPHRLPHTNPFLAPAKKNRTTKTCSAAMPTMKPLSINEKRKMRFSVLRTVLKLRFSRVRKYFCWREIVLSWPDSL